MPRFAFLHNCFYYFWPAVLPSETPQQLPNNTQTSCWGADHTQPARGAAASSRCSVFLPVTATRLKPHSSLVYRGLKRSTALRGLKMSGQPCTAGPRLLDHDTRAPTRGFWRLDCVQGLHLLLAWSSPSPPGDFASRVCDGPPGSQSKTSLDPPLPRSVDA